MGEPMTLGEIIKGLEDIANKSREYEEGDLAVRYDFCNLKPTHLDSYRGYYDQLALGYSDGCGEGDTLKGILKEFKSAVGKEFYGYKGGTYKMGLNTDVYVDNYGDCSGTMITGVEYKDGVVVLCTEYNRY
jgi:hypothetical protein